MLRARAGVALDSQQPYLGCMRVIACVLLLVGCGSTVPDAVGAGGSAGAGDVGGSGGFTAPSDAGSGGSVGGSASAGSSAAGMATGGSETSAGGAAGDRSDAGGAAGDLATAGSAGDGGDGGAAPVEPVPGSLWSRCSTQATSELLCSNEFVCGQYLEREGGQPGYVCTFQCWSLQGTKVAPDAGLIAHCAELGGVCYAASSGYYPTCVPALPEHVQ